MGSADLLGQSLFGAPYLASGPEDHDSFCLEDAEVSLMEVDETLCCKYAFALTDTGSAAIVGAEGTSPLTEPFVGDTGTVCDPVRSKGAPLTDPALELAVLGGALVVPVAPL